MKNFKTSKRIVKNQNTNTRDASERKTFANFHKLSISKKQLSVIKGGDDIIITDIIGS